MRRSSFRGHMVHDDAPTAEARIDPDRMVQAYNHATATLNLVRAFTKGGFADLMRVHEWNQEFVASSPEGRRYEQLASEIERALRFMAACGIDLSAESQLHQVDVWTSHEGLVLDYEEALTRRDSTTGDWYDCSAHMLWIGERTRQPDGAHVEFFSGVLNPLGVKVGPTATPDEIVELCERLNPGRVPGRLTLIARMGAERVFDLLPPILAPCGTRASRSCGPRIPCTRTSSRPSPASRPAASTRSWPRSRASSPLPQGARLAGGVHLEFTGEDVTECLGGGEAVLEEQLNARYMTLCDPRLNAAPVARPRLPARRARASGGTLMALEKLAVVGTGLIGASVGLAAKRAGSATSPATTPTRSSWPQRPSGARSTSRSAASSRRWRPSSSWWRPRGDARGSGSGTCSTRPATERRSPTSARRSRRSAPPSPTARASSAGIRSAAPRRGGRRAGASSSSTARRGS